MNKKVLYATIGVGAGAAVLAGVVLNKGVERGGQETAPESYSGIFAPEVEEVLAAKTSLLEELVKDPVIIREVEASNELHRGITQNEINTLDQKWISAGSENDFVNSFLTNILAAKLLKFQKTHQGFSEIFITDRYGLNVGQTNKTSDYYQADEAWWIGSFNAGEGNAYHGPIEFDESAQTEAISLYVPVIDPATGGAVGVIKAVLGAEHIKSEL